MRTKRRSIIARRVWVALVLAALSGGALTGCAGRYMVPTLPPETLAADPAAATVVFLRPSSYGAGARFVVVDGDGSYLGEILGREFFVEKFSPGERTFVSWAENADMVVANLAAGKIYYVLLSVRMGIWTARMSLSALTPDRDEWPKLGKWMDDSRQMSPDEAKIAKWVANHEDDVQSRMRSAQEAWSVYDEKKRAVRTLEPDDGFATPQH